MKRFVIIATVASLVACSSSQADSDAPAPEQDRQNLSSTVDLGVPRSEIPPPGRCRVMAAGFLMRNCDGIENTAPLGVRILYRLDDGSRRVVVCYMSTSERNEIIGVDLFDFNTGRLIRALQKRDDPPIADSCGEVVPDQPGG